MGLGTAVVSRNEPHFRRSRDLRFFKNSLLGWIEQGAIQLFEELRSERIELRMLVRFCAGHNRVLNIQFVQRLVACEFNSGIVWREPVSRTAPGPENLHRDGTGCIALDEL